VLHDGVLSPAVSATKLTAERVGLLMGGDLADATNMASGASA